MAPSRARDSGELEGEVVACLAASDAPLTPAEVRQRLGRDLAYTTVMTTLSRLHAKQALTRSRRGRAYAYELVDDTTGVRASMTAHQMRRLLADGADRAKVLSRFVDGLDDESGRILRELLDRAPDDHPDDPS